MTEIIIIVVFIALYALMQKGYVKKPSRKLIKQVVIISSVVLTFAFSSIGLYRYIEQTYCVNQARYAGIGHAAHQVRSITLHDIKLIFQSHEADVCVHILKLNGIFTAALNADEEWEYTLTPEGSEWAEWAYWRLENARCIANNTAVRTPSLLASPDEIWLCPERAAQVQNYNAMMEDVYRSNARWEATHR